MNFCYKTVNSDPFLPPKLRLEMSVYLKMVSRGLTSFSMTRLTSLRTPRAVLARYLLSSASWFKPKILAMWSRERRTSGASSITWEAYRGRDVLVFFLLTKFISESLLLQRDLRRSQQALQEQQLRQGLPQQQAPQQPVLRRLLQRQAPQERGQRLQRVFRR